MFEFGACCCVECCLLLLAIAYCSLESLLICCVPVLMLFDVLFVVLFVLFACLSCLCLFDLRLEHSAPISANWSGLVSRLRLLCCLVIVVCCHCCLLFAVLFSHCLVIAVLFEL